MASKSSGSVISILVALAIFGFFKFQKLQSHQNRRYAATTFRQRAKETAKKEFANDKAFLEKFFAAITVGDFDSAVSMTTNPPPNISESTRKEIGKYGNVYKKFGELMSDIARRSDDEGMDLELMTSPKFYTGHDGVDEAINRIDISVRYIDEMETRINEIRLEMQSLKSPKANKAFNVDSQWNGMMRGLKDSFSSLRAIAGTIESIIKLHVQHSKAWKWDGDGPLYFGSDFCDRINMELQKVSSLSQQFLDSQNVMSENHESGIKKIRKGLDEAERKMK